MALNATDGPSAEPTTQPLSILTLGGACAGGAAAGGESACGTGAAGVAAGGASASAACAVSMAIRQTSQVFGIPVSLYLSCGAPTARTTACSQPCSTFARAAWARKSTSDRVGERHA